MAEPLWRAALTEALASGVSKLSELDHAFAIVQRDARTTSPAVLRDRYLHQGAYLHAYIADRLAAGHTC